MWRRSGLTEYACGRRRRIERNDRRNLRTLFDSEGFFKAYTLREGAHEIHVRSFWRRTEQTAEGIVVTDGSDGEIADSFWCDFYCGGHRGPIVGETSRRWPAPRRYSY